MFIVGGCFYREESLKIKFLNLLQIFTQVVNLRKILFVTSRQFAWGQIIFPSTKTTISDAWQHKQFIYGNFHLIFCTDSISDMKHSKPVSDRLCNTFAWPFDYYKMSWMVGIDPNRKCSIEEDHQQAVVSSEKCSL